MPAITHNCPQKGYKSIRTNQPCAEARRRANRQVKFRPHWPQPAGSPDYPLVAENGLIEIGLSSDGRRVFDRPRSHHKLEQRLLSSVLSRVRLTGRRFVRELIEFGSEIGLTTCVATFPEDQIVYARRPGRFGATRFVVNRCAEPCSSVVAIFKQMEERPDCHLLITAFIGGLPEPEPWDRNATAASHDFWANHALIWGSCEVLPETQTSDCPWKL